MCSGADLQGRSRFGADTRTASHAGASAGYTHKRRAIDAPVQSCRSRALATKMSAEQPLDECEERLVLRTADVAQQEKGDAAICDMLA